MSRLIGRGLYLYPTPGGAWYAGQSTQAEPGRALLQQLLLGDEAPLLDDDWLAAATGLAADEAQALLQRLQSLGFVQGLTQTRFAPDGALDQLLVSRLKVLSEEGRAALSDSQGLYVASAGFSHEAAEELSALSAELAALGERHRGLLNANLGLPGSGWGLMGAGGYSDIGFWPLHLGGQRFALIVQGQPQFNQPALTQLLWALGRRYGKAETPAAEALTNRR